MLFPDVKEICKCPPPYWRLVHQSNGCHIKHCKYCGLYAGFEIFDKVAYKSYKISLALTTPNFDSMLTPFEKYQYKHGKDVEQIIIKYFGEKYFEV